MARRRERLYILCLLVGVACAVACTGPTSRPTLPFYKMGESIHAIAVLPDGAVWVSTSEYGELGGTTSVSYGTGVARFDGERWTTYPAVDRLTDNLIGPIVGTPDGMVWFGAWNSVLRFDGKRWTTVTPKDGLVQEVMSIAIAPDGTLWFGTWNGLLHFDGRRWTTYTTRDGLADDVVEDIVVTVDGVVWIGTRDYGVSHFDGEIWQTYTEENGLLDDSVRAIAVDADGVVWVGSHNGVSRFDGKTWTYYTEEHGLAASGVRYLVVAPDGTVWVAYFDWHVGVSHFDGETWVTFGDSLPSNSVSGIAVGPDSVLWVSTEAGTVSRFDGETWTTWTMDEISP